MNTAVRSLVRGFCIAALLAAFTPSVGAQKADPIVYLAPTGKKYHSTQDCRSLRHSKRIEKLKRSQAQKSGYLACKFCA